MEASYNFLHTACYTALAKIEFRYLYKNSKNSANYKEFLTKFVNINNHMHNFLHGVLILQDAKNHSQHEKIFVALQKITF